MTPPGRTRARFIKGLEVSLLKRAGGGCRHADHLLGPRRRPRRRQPRSSVDSVNPADLDDIVAQVRLAAADGSSTACRQARAAQPAWAAVPAPVRGQVIGAIGRIVADNKESLARLVTREVGKPIAEARGEVQEIIDTCDFFLGEGRRLYGETVPSEMTDKQLFTFRVPVGWRR